MASFEELVSTELLVWEAQDRVLRLCSHLERMSGSTASHGHLLLQMLATMRETMQLMLDYRNTIHRELLGNPVPTAHAISACFGRVEVTAATLKQSIQRLESSGPSPSLQIPGSQLVHDDHAGTRGI